MFEVAASVVVGLFLGILISWFYWRRQVSDREAHVEDLESSIKSKDSNLKDVRKRLKKQDTEIESLNTQLSEMEETIQDLTAEIKEKDNSINRMKEEMAGLENSIEEKEQEVTSLEARSRTMQDNFAHIVGIGPKVSVVLRSAGINTFAQLASTEVNRIRDILEAENPRLLRLTDPSSWPEQAKMIAEGDWEALSSLQDNLKGARRT